MQYQPQLPRAVGATIKSKLEVTYFGLPISLLFAAFRYDKRDTELTQHIEQLERIWNKPQH